MSKPQNTVTEPVPCAKCGSTGWRMYAKRGNRRYFICKKCGHHRVDRIVTKLRVIRN